MYWDRLREAVAEVETSGDNLMIDQATFLLGMFKDDYAIDSLLRNCPKMLALLPEMKAEPNKFRRLLSCSDWMNREDALGRVADLLRKAFQNA